LHDDIYKPQRACQRGKKRPSKLIVVVGPSIKKRSGEMGLGDMRIGEMRRHRPHWAFVGDYDAPHT